MNAMVKTPLQSGNDLHHGQSRIPCPAAGNSQNRGGYVKHHCFLPLSVSHLRSSKPGGAGHARAILPLLAKCLRRERPADCLTLDTVKPVPRLFTLLLVFFMSIQTFADCEVWEIIDMIDEDEDRADIKDACDSYVTDANLCSVSKVYRLYDHEGMDEQEIIDLCTGQSSSFDDDSQDSIARFCTTSIGSCPLVVAMPRGAVCGCSNFPGIPGVAH